MSTMMHARSTKTCPDCGQTRAQSLFGRKGEFEHCNDCRRVRRAAEKDASTEEMPRACARCEVVKPLDEYEVTTKDGKCRRAVCKPCYAEQKKERANKGAESHAPDSTPKPEACTTCGRAHPEVDFKWRSDVKKGGWRPECNACHNAKDYSGAYRARERQKDEGGYLKRNAEAHLKWAHNNKDKVLQQQELTRTDPGRKYKLLVTSASARNIDVTDADADAMRAKFRCACFYCDFLPAAGEPLNGLDRLSCSAGFSDPNTVPCCATCNAMKACMDMDEFIVAVRRVATHCGLRHSGNDEPRQRERLPSFGGRADLRAAPSKTRADMLNGSQKAELWSNPCYLCARTPALGIDRVDADGDYTPENARSCCTDCNYMKKDLCLDDFKEHISHIGRHTDQWVLRDTLDVPLKTNTGVRREPVGMFDSAGELLLVFPSQMTAARVMDVSNVAICRAANTGDRLRGMSWRIMQPHAYRSQCADASACRDLFSDN